VALIGCLFKHGPTILPRAIEGRKDKPGAPFSNMFQFLVTLKVFSSGIVEYKLAGGRGFEPQFTSPEPVVLPLDDPPTVSRTRRKAQVPRCSDTFQSTLASPMIISSDQIINGGVSCERENHLAKTLVSL
jgi:hypothetical protein